MKDFENKLNNLKIPVIEDEVFENNLRRQLVKKYFNTGTIYKRRFRLALTFASLLAIFSFIAVLNPGIPHKLNQLAFRQEEPDYDKILDQGQPLISGNMHYTSINNPQLKGKINPDKFREDKAYVIRKYTSATDGSIMIVSEFNQKPEPKKIHKGSL